jgi:uncharacterized OB-fold protein
MLKDNQRLVMDGIIKLPSQAGALPRLLGNKCSTCGMVYFPKRAVCSGCFGDTLAEHELSTEGTIYSYTVIHYPHPLGFPVPYAYGLVDLPEDKVRVAAMFTERENLKIGMKVKLVLDKLSSSPDGKEVIGFKFQPVRE